MDWSRGAYPLHWKPGSSQYICISIFNFADQTIGTNLFMFNFYGGGGGWMIGTLLVF